MKNKLFALGTLALLANLNSQLLTLCAQSTPFTYQGRLNASGVPANGSFDLRFSLHGDAILPGFEVGLPRTNNAVSVTNGLFTTVVDFGFGWDNQSRWLELGVRPAGSLNDFASLTPRQPVTATPKADYANRAAGLTGPLPEYFLPTPVVRDYVDDTISGLFTFAPLSGNPPFLVNSSVRVNNLNADLLDGLDSSAFWKSSGNSGTSPGVNFLGTTDDRPFEIRANNQPILRLAHASGPVFTSPNIVGGFSENRVNPGFVGGFIGGGGSPAFPPFPSDPNVIDNNFGSIGGGLGNTAGGFVSVVGGGRFNFSGAADSVIGGGFGNTNSIFAEWATIGGGHYNSVNGLWGTVPGGANNTVSGRYGFAAGRRAKALHDGAFVWADSTDADFASTANNQFLIRANGGMRLSDDTPSLSFGATTRQMLNLYNNTYGIGVQAGTFYQRSDSRFSWYRGGTHSNNENDPGAGGIRLMTIDGNGEFHVGGGIFAGLSLQNRETPNFVVGPTAGERYVWYVSQGVCRLWSGNEKMSVNNAGIVTAMSFNPTSDRNAKENFEPINSREMLEKVAALPITRWNFKQDRTSEHLGPMAQDFHAAFGLGTDDKHIATVDADGVALAAIQGLNEKVEARSQKSEVRIQKLEAENAALQRELAEIKSLLVKRSAKAN